jgi:hypothetical protein
MSTLATTNIKHPSSASNNIVLDSSGNVVLQAGTASAPALQPTSDPNTGIFFPAADTIAFAEGGSEAMRIDSSSRLLVGTSSSLNAGALFQSAAQTGIAAELFRFSSGAGFDGALFYLTRSKSGSTGIASAVAAGDGLGAIVFNAAGDSSTYVQGAKIAAQVDTGTVSATSMPSRLVFSTTADGASSPTERMRITNNGVVAIGKTVTDLNTAGMAIASGGEFNIARNGDVASFNRIATDGQIVRFFQDATEEGSISVSGTTVSYNGAHLSRWSQLVNDEDPSALLKGTVMSNLDEMCEWGEEDNEQLNRTKVSDVEGDPNVAGVFVATSFSDDGPLDFFVGMTGDMIIRIGEGVTVQRGDLLMSAGDGTAKPQGDGFVQDKTIAKVTSTHVTCTYDDGSYCVPCVLMAC